MNTDLIQAAMATWAAKDLPARLYAAQVAKLLNCTTDDVALLTTAGKLKPLGRPRPNAVKLFSTIELITLLADREWLDDATKTIGQYWRRKNERRAGYEPQDEPAPRPVRPRRHRQKPSTKPSTISSTSELEPSSERVIADSEGIVTKAA